MFEVRALLNGSIGVRHWIAWQLQQLAWYIYHDGEFEQQLTLLDGDAEVANWTISADAYGHGLSSQFIPPGFHYTVRHRDLDDNGVVIEEW